MKNKVVTTVCSVLIILAIICFGYIFLNSGRKEENNSNVNNVGEEPEENEIVQREERTQNVVLTSRIGVQLRELIRYSDIYSNIIINELDTNGLSDKAKIGIALDKIFRKEEYQDLRSESDDYTTTYITSVNMHKVIDNTFADKDVQNTNLDDSLSYDESSNSFIILPMGFENGSLEYTVEVPYKITEYTDRIELLAYRVYITKNVEMQEVTSTVTNSLYYDKTKTYLATTITDDRLSNESTQADEIKKIIDSNVIDADNLDKVQYTFIKENETYKISDFKKI